MAIDLTGGMDPALEAFLTQRPRNPDMRDSASLWIMDDGGDIAFPRITIDAIGSQWDRPAVQLNLVLADGRACRIWNDLPRDANSRAAGNSAVLEAGSMRFQCIEPFRHWTLSFSGTVQQSTTTAQMSGQLDGTALPLAFHFDARMVAPPWLMGGMTAEAARLISSSAEGSQMGGLRYEQLCQITGWVRIDDEERCIAGTGMRVRRQGVRSMATATGHCQHSAVFPSGRAIGAIAFAPRPDGVASFNEGFIYTEDRRRFPARVASAPWMTHLQARGENVPLLLESELGSIQIGGETLLTTFDHHLFEMADVSVLQQGSVRYVWDGEEAIGLIERCTHRQRLAGFR